MSHRTQLTLSDEQYKRLTAGVSLAELVRRAVDRAYGADPAALDDSFGAWKGRSFDGEQYVEWLRGGLSRRLEERDGRPR